MLTAAILAAAMLHTVSGVACDSDGTLLKRGPVFDMRQVNLGTGIGGYPVVELHACVHSTGASVKLTDAVFIRESLQINGPRAGWAAMYCDDDSVCSEGVSVVDVLRPAGPANPRNSDAGPGLQKVGSLRMRGNGGFAWIACRVSQTVSYDPRRMTRRAPQCDGPDDRTITVYALDSVAVRKRRLDSGSTIDPTSLRLAGSRLTWRHGGKRRSARLR